MKLERHVYNNENENNAKTVFQTKVQKKLTKRILKTKQTVGDTEKQSMDYCTA